MSGISNLLNGWWFYFVVQDHQITVHLSMWSGRERIWVDDCLVSRKFNYGLRSSHEFEVEEVVYKVEAHVTSYMIAEFKCTLIGDELTEKATLALLPRNFWHLDGVFFKLLAVTSATAFAAGLLVGILGGLREMQLDKDTLREKRLDLGWTQQQLADACGISLRTVQRIEKSGVASLDTTAALSAVFEVDRRALLYTSPSKDALKPNLKILIAGSVLLGFLLGTLVTVTVA